MLAHPLPSTRVVTKWSILLRGWILQGNGLLLRENLSNLPKIWPRSTWRTMLYFLELICHFSLLFLLSFHIVDCIAMYGNQFSSWNYHESVQRWGNGRYHDKWKSRENYPYPGNPFRAGYYRVMLWCHLQFLPSVHRTRRVLFHTNTCHIEARLRHPQPQHQVNFSMYHIAARLFLGILRTEAG